MLEDRMQECLKLLHNYNDYISQTAITVHVNLILR